MLKRTLLFLNRCRLSLSLNQLVVETEGEQTKSIPIEDIGFVVIDNAEIRVTIPVLNTLTENNAAVIFCNAKHHPKSMLLNLDAHHLQNELFRNQIDATTPLKKSLWKQTIISKINNQAAILAMLNKNCGPLYSYAKQVKSGDIDNREGAAARYYWQELLGNKFIRDRYGDPPNHLLNYGYAILRAAVARSLVGSGLLPTLGIHHHNKYNAYCLADDIMEPYRPYVDLIAEQMHCNNPDEHILTKQMKIAMLQILSCDVKFKHVTRPLLVGLSQTTASLARCFCREATQIEYPQI